MGQWQRGRSDSFYLPATLLDIKVSTPIHSVYFRFQCQWNKINCLLTTLKMTDDSVLLCYAWGMCLYIPLKVNLYGIIWSWLGTYSISSMYLSCITPFYPLIGPVFCSCRSSCWPLQSKVKGHIHPCTGEGMRRNIPSNACYFSGKIFFFTHYFNCK